MLKDFREGIKHGTEILENLGMDALLLECREQVYALKDKVNKDYIDGMFTVWVANRDREKYPEEVPSYETNDNI